MKEPSAKFLGDFIMENYAPISFRLWAMARLIEWRRLDVLKPHSLRGNVVWLWKAGWLNEELPPHLRQARALRRRRKPNHSTNKNYKPPRTGKPDIPPPPMGQPYSRGPKRR